MSTFRQSWHEIIGKTIAMITASPDYQRYINEKRLRLLKGSESSRRIGRRRNNELKENVIRECTECNAGLLSRSKTGLCKACLQKAIAAAQQSGLSMSEIANRLGLIYAHIYYLLHPKPKKISPKPVQPALLDQAESIAEEAFRDSIGMVTA